MADIDLNPLSLDELKKLRKDVDKAIVEFEERKRKEALAAVEALAKEAGFSLDELVSAKKSKKTVTAPKYRHPENPALTWTGRGRKPAWFVELTESGTPAEQLLIQN